MQLIKNIGILAHIDAGKTTITNSMELEKERGIAIWANSASVKPYVRLVQYNHLKEHLNAFVMAYNFAKRLKSLNRLSVFDFIVRSWADNADFFIL